MKKKYIKLHSAMQDSVVIKTCMCDGNPHFFKNTFNVAFSDERATNAKIVLDILNFITFKTDLLFRHGTVLY